MGRNRKDIYIFISDDKGKYYRAKQDESGNYIISNMSQPYPISFNPPNINKSPVEFATNSKYFSLNRSISYPLDFIKDGAAVLRHLYFNGKGISQKAYVTIIEWNGLSNIYELSYRGRVAFKQKKETPKSGVFSVSMVDDSAWGILSSNDEVVYAIDCSYTNPKSVRVLVDSMTLRNNYTFQTVNAPITTYDGNGYHSIPFVLINQDGDSVGIVTKNQTTYNFNTIIPPDLVDFFSTAYPINNVNISGSFKFTWSINDAFESGGLVIYFYTKSGQKIDIFSMPGSTGHLIRDKIYNVDFNFDLNLDVSDTISFISLLSASGGRLFTITPIVTNIVISTLTVTEPAIVYGLRAIDLLKELVDKATNGRYTINSNYLTQNNKDICLSGDAIRGIPNAKIYSSFYEFFKTFDSLKFMALKSPNGSLSLELASQIYQSGDEIIDLGEVIDLEIEPASEYYCNEVEVGSPDVDYRRPSGRLEFNSTNTFSINIEGINKKLDIVTKYHTGCYEIIFLLLDYRGQSSQDNSGDKKTYLLDITDEKAMAVENIETFENVTFNSAPLQPIIKSPYDNDVITYDLPIIRGIAPVGNTVNIYVDSVLDGGTVADIDGNWSYQIVNPLSSFVESVSTGEHIVEATYTDDAAPKSTINLVINTSITTSVQIYYPQSGDSLYNNKPLIRGVGQQGTPVNLTLDGVLIATIVCDSSCKWEYKSGVILNGDHVLDANGDAASFNVDTNVDYPLITYVGSELDGFLVINNLPLIEGVALPGTIVSVWLNYISYVYLGQALADINGNWSLQVIPTSYKDPLSNIDIFIAPIMNGLVVISTSLTNHIVGINVSGYKLNRPNYTSITGVIDNTVFNTRYSPKEMLLNHSPLLSAILNQQRNEKIKFQKHSKNANLSRTIGGITITENTDVDFSSLGKPIALLEYALLKIKSLKTFNKVLYEFNQGGVIKATSRGTDLYMLPIGSMKMQSIVNDVKEWKLLFSPEMTYKSLLNLYKNGLTINIMKNSLYHSDYNTLHFVTYNFQDITKYNFKSIYDDWFENRNTAWLLNPEYIQKVQKSDPLVDQIIVNGLVGLSLNMYDCKTALLVDTIPYLPVVPAPISTPEVVLEAIIDLTLYDEGEYFFVQFLDEIPLSISERIYLKEKHEGTIFVNAYSSLNKTGCFFSTGFTSSMRIEGLMKKLQPFINTIKSSDDIGNTELLYGLSSRKQEVRFGTAYGLPDYLYLKIALFLCLDNVEIENNLYSLSEDEKIQAADDVEGHPLYYYNVLMDFKVNELGKTFMGVDGDVNGRFFLVADATAFGLPVGSLINIELENE